MKLTLKDLIAIGIVTVDSLPVLYLIALFLLGYARLEIGPMKLDPDERRQVRLMRQTWRRDSLAVVMSQTYRANQAAADSLEEERKRLQREKDQVELIKAELEREREGLQRERERLEELISQSQDLQDKRVKQLARVYGAMRPAEAARILETLSDDLVVKILRGMGDARQSGKIMQALSGGKAKRISVKMGKTAVTN